MNKTSNERGEGTTDTEIQRIIRKYYQWLYTNKVNNLKQMGKFLKTYKSSKIVLRRNRKSEQSNSSK